jgi:2-(3-amino-3-carboxypropyl)histidine synthase
MKGRFMRILLQFPEGLKQQALKHAKMLELEGNEVFISASPSFGACDLALDEAKSIKADKIVHFGHSEFCKADLNVEYVEYRVDAPLDMLESSLPYLKGFETLGLVTTIQHVHQLETIKEFYERNGKKVLIGRPYGSAKRAGQVLGCDVGSAASIDGDVSAFVYFGGGMFHPLGALLSTTKPFFVVDPFMNKVESIDGYRETYRKKSRGKVLAALDARNFAIMVSTKPGQFNIESAEALKSRIREAGLCAEIVVANTFDFDSLNNMLEFDAFVNTACPRLAMHDTDRLRKPLLSAGELMELLGMKAELQQRECKAKKDKE